MNNDWVFPVASHMLGGLYVTLWVSLFTTLLATVLGVFVGGLSASASPWVQLGVRLYIDIFRGVPSLITLLFVFFALPHVGITTGPMTASVLGVEERNNCDFERISCDPERIFCEWRPVGGIAAGPAVEERNNCKFERING